MSRSALRTGAAAALCAAAALLWAPPASAQGGDCDGVTVVVDPGEGEPRVGCADDPDTGLEALTQAGFAITEVTSFPGAVCRIDDHPEADCGPMPPADASWSYWYASTSDSEWKFATAGAHMRDPDDGDVEGWAFGDGSDPPDIAPHDAAATEPEPKAESESGRSWTWVIAPIVLTAIAGLVLWRARRNKLQ